MCRGAVRRVSPAIDACQSQSHRNGPSLRSVVLSLANRTPTPTPSYNLGACRDADNLLAQAAPKLEKHPMTVRIRTDSRNWSSFLTNAYSRRLPPSDDDTDDLSRGCCPRLRLEVLATAPRQRRVEIKPLVGKSPRDPRPPSSWRRRRRCGRSRRFGSAGSGRF